MERFNIFQLIHKGLRASLYHTALQLQQTDFTVEDETEAALNKVKEIVMLFDAHAHKEDHFVLPAIRAYEPSVVAGFESEHEADEALGRALHDCIEKVEDANALLEKIIAGRALSEAFVAFTVFNLQHMAKEEDILNRILWRYYSDEEIRQISGAITRSVAPWMQDFYLTWMLRGICNGEAVEWMKAIERTAPPVVLQTLLQKAEGEWSRQRFHAVTNAITEGEMVAA